MNEIKAFYSISDNRFIIPDLGRAFGNVPLMDNFKQHPAIKRYFDSLHYDYNLNIEYLDIY